jgi:hypothetical protein
MRNLRCVNTVARRDMRDSHARRALQGKEEKARSGQYGTLSGFA